MGSSTKGIINKNVTLLSIFDYIKSDIDAKAEMVDERKSRTQRVVLSEGEARVIGIHSEDTCLHDTGIDGILLSLGATDKGKEIMKSIVTHFGGYYMEDDCSDDRDFVPIDPKRFLSYSGVSKKDIFTNKIISKLGNNNLKAVLELFEEYKTNVILPEVEKAVSNKLYADMVYESNGESLLAICGYKDFMEQIKNSI